MPLRKGNSKLGKNVWQWSIPIQESCTPSGWCHQFCYAKKGRFLFPSVKKAGERNWEEAKSESFVQDTIDQIKKQKIDLVRIHVYGDFFSTDYIGKWEKIIKSCPETRFLAYTKRGDLAAQLTSLNTLSNLALFESMDDSKTKRRIPGIPMSIIGGSKWETGEDKECPGECEPCGFTCWDKTAGKNVIFHKH